jgi:hypothetical protein
MKRSVIILLLFCFFAKLHAADTLQFKRHPKIYFFTAGLQAYGPEQMGCRNRQAAKMSFGYKRKAGCVVGPLKYARIRSHNKRVEEKMVKRYGADWRKKYQELLKDC